MGESSYAFNFGIGTGQVTGGPNNGLFFVTSLTDSSSYIWELNPGLTNSGDPFYQAQSGTCWAGVQAIIDAVKAHEYGEPGPSHYTEVRDFLAVASNNPATAAESAVGQSISDLNKAVKDAYGAAFNAGVPEPPGGATLPPNINYPPYTTCN
jgi:hypothetical protein